MKNLTPFKICHLILMAALFIGASYGMIMYFGGFKLAVQEKSHLEVLVGGFSIFFVMGMLAVGILYLLNEYSKNAAIFYKVFLVMLLLLTIFVTFMDVYFVELDAPLIVKSVLYVAKIIALFILAFWKDLGKHKTLTFALMILAFDILAVISWIIHMAATGFDFNIMGVAAAIVADVTVLLAIKGKYADKAERGSH